MRVLYRASNVLSDVIEGMLIDVVTGTFTCALAVLAGAAMVIPAWVKEGLIKLIMDATVGVTVMIYSDG